MFELVDVFNISKEVPNWQTFLRNRKELLDVVAKDDTCIRIGTGHNSILALPYQETSTLLEESKQLYKCESSKALSRGKNNAVNAMRSGDLALGLKRHGTVDAVLIRESLALSLPEKAEQEKRRQLFERNMQTATQLFQSCVLSGAPCEFKLNGDEITLNTGHPDLLNVQKIVENSDLSYEDVMEALNQFMNNKNDMP